MVIRVKKQQIVIAFAAAVLCVVCLVIASASFQENSETKTEAASTAVQASVLRLPVIMYHQVMNSEKRLGKYVISSAQLEKDLTYIRSLGYTTVDVKDIIDYVENGKALPEKCVMLTFDDGFESMYAIVAPMLESFDMCAVTNVIGYVADMYSGIDDHNLSYSYMTWQEIGELAKGDTVEVHNHTYNMHSNKSGQRKGMGRLKGEDTEDYLRKVTEDLWQCEDKLTQVSGETPEAIFYPFGVYNELLQQLIKTLGYKASFVCEERVSILTAGDSESLYNIGRYNRPSGITSEEFFKKML